MACVLWSGRVWAASVEAARIIYLSRAEQHERKFRYSDSGVAGA